MKRFFKLILETSKNNSKVSQRNFELENKVFEKEWKIFSQKVLYEQVIKKLLILLSAVLFYSTLVVGQELLPGNWDFEGETLTLTADEVIYWREENRLVARGNVFFSTPHATVYCDELEVWYPQGEVEARGNVRVENPQGSIRAQKFRFNFKSDDVMVVDADLYLADSHSRVTGKSIEKIGKGKYIIIGAEFTSCRCEEGKKPDWSLRAGEIDIKAEGYARTKKTTFRVKDTPIFYIPFAVFPVKERRQTGFLMPRLDYSTRDDFEFILPFYWAAARWCDFTLEEDFIAKRGLKQNLEFRWRSNFSSMGKLTLFYLDDRFVEENRFAFTLEGTQSLLGRARLNSDLRYVSDNEYVRDFRLDDVISDPRASFLEGNIIFVAPFNSFEAYLLFSYLDDLMGDDVDTRLQRKDTDNAMPQSIPTAGGRFALSPIGKGPLWWRMRFRGDSLYLSGPTTYWHEPSVTVEDAWSQRLDMEPVVALSLERNGMYFLPELAFRETVWFLRVGDDAYRHLAIIRLESGFRAWRIYQGHFKHRVEPRIRYTYTKDLDPSERPPFDLDDQLSDLNELELNLDQRLFVRKIDDFGVGRGEEVLRFEITQKIDLEDGEFRILRGELDITPSPYVLVRLDAKYDLKQGEYEYASAGARFFDKRRDSLDFIYRYQRYSQQFFITHSQVRLVKWLALTYFHYFDIENMIFVDHAAGFIIEPPSDCWLFEFGVSYHTDPEEFRYSGRFILFGFGER